MIIEDRKSWRNFMIEFEENDSIVIPIQCDDNKHPWETELCVLYVQFLNGVEYVLPFRHSDALNLNSKYIPLTQTPKNTYVYDKKKLLHFFKWDNVFDVQLSHYMKTNEPLIIEDLITSAHEHFYRDYYDIPNINCVIPLMKHIEWCRELVKILKSASDTDKDNKSYNVYNNDVLENLNYIESSGLQTTDGMVYSEYNPYTLTGRPSNRFGGINFAALNKKDGSREKFVSRFGKDGMLVEMDYDAYHPSIIADIVGYKFDGDVYVQLGKYYGTAREESKILTFQYLYGHIPDDVLRVIPFFVSVDNYINDMWREYNHNGYTETALFKRKIYKQNLTNMNKNKLFNYFLQSAEFEYSVTTMTKLREFIGSGNCKSKFILYTYDSFLFDMHLSDGKDFILTIKDILEDEKFKVKVKYGFNYHNMSDFIKI